MRQNRCKMVPFPAFAISGSSEKEEKKRCEPRTIFLGLRTELGDNSPENPARSGPTDRAPCPRRQGSTADPAAACSTMCISTLVLGILQEGISRGEVVRAFGPTREFEQRKQPKRTRKKGCRRRQAHYRVQVKYDEQRVYTPPRMTVQSPFPPHVWAPGLPPT